MSEEFLNSVHPESRYSPFTKIIEIAINLLEERIEKRFNQVINLMEQRYERPKHSD